MKIKFYASIIFLLAFQLSNSASGQTVQAIANGPWNVGSTWDTGTVPDAENSTSIVIDGVTVNIPATYSVTVDQVQLSAKNTSIIQVDEGGTLILQDDGTTTIDLELKKSFGYARLYVNGTFQVEQGATLSGNLPNALVVGSGGVYKHNYTTTAGDIYSSTWNTGSTLAVTGYTSNTSPPTGLSQSFYNLVWNCPNQGDFVVLNGNITSVQNNLDISSTGTGGLVLTDATNYSLTVNNFIVSGASNVYFNVSASSSITVNNNFSFTSSGSANFTESGPFILNVAGNLTVDGTGSLDLVFNLFGGTASTTTINADGDVLLTNGSVSVSHTSGSATLNFQGASLQTYAKTGGSVSSTTPLNYVVKSNSSLNAGTSTFTGSGNFTLESGAILQLASANTTGAIANQVAVTGSKTYGTDATIVLNNSDGIKQYLGAGFPRSSNVNLEINNSGGVDLADDFTIDTNAELILTNGSFNVQSNTIRFIGGIRAGGSGSLDFVSTSNLRISKDGDFNALPLQGFEELNKLTLDGASTTASLTSSLSVDSLVFANSSSLAVGSNTLSISEYYEGENATNGGGGLNVSTGSILEIGPDTNNDNLALGNLTFIGGNTLRKLIINRPGGSVSVPSTLNVTDTLSLLNGTLNNASGAIKLADGATIVKQGGTSFANTPGTSGTGTSYNILYKGTLDTGKELNNVAAANIKNITTEAGSVVTLHTDITQPVTINGYLLNNGSLNTNGETLDIKGDITNNSVLNPSGSTFLFSGTTQIGGTSNLTISNVEITGSLTASNAGILEAQGNWFVNGGTFNPNGGTVEFSGSSLQSITSAAQPFFNVNISGSGGISLADAMDVDGAYTLASTSSFTHGTNPVNIGGNVVLQGTLNQGEGIFTLDGSNQSITSNGKAFRNLTFGGSGTKTIQDSLSVTRNLVINSTLSTGGFSRNIAVGGNWENNGSFVANSGTVYFNGSATQVISGIVLTDFNNMTVTNTAGPPGLRVNANTRLLGVLTLADNVRLDPDGEGGDIDFILVSSASRTAAIAELPTGAVVNGNVVVQRHIPAANVFRYIATPVQGTTVAGWGDDFTISSNSIYKWDETITRSGVGYVPYGESTNPLAVGGGYAVKMPSTAEPIIASTRGPVQHDGNSVDLSVTYTSTGDATDDGWNLVGNPYPSAIDLESTGWTWTNVNPTVSIPDNSSTTDGLKYATYNRETNTGINNGSQYIASGQAFWVQTTTTSPSLIATEAVKAGSETGTQFFRKAPPKDYLIIALNQGDKRDEAAIFFRNDATEAYDNLLDSPKRQNGIFNLATLTKDSLEVSFNLRPWFECSTEVALKISNIGTGAYTLDFKELNSFTQAVDILLIDRYTNNSVAVEEGFEYEFVVTEEAASKGAGRFSLLFGEEAPMTNLVVEGSTICENEAEAFVGIESSEAGVTYQVFKGEEAVSEVLEGNGAALSLSVAANLLETGSNEVRIVAGKENCESIELDQTATVMKNQLFEVTNVQGASSCGSASLNLQAGGAPEGASYRWYTSADAATPIEGATEAALVTPELTTTTTYYVSIVSSSGCESAKTAVTATINPVYEVQEVTGASSCGSASLNLQASGAPEGASYRWYTSAETTTPIEGATEASFTTPVLSGSTTYWVSIMNNAGCESTERVAVTAEINSLSKPEIQQEEGTLISSYTEGNQWFLNGKAIEGAVEQSFMPTTSGTYSVQVQLGECQAVSEAFEFTVAGIEEDLAAIGIQVYPSPAQQELRINYGIKEAKEVNYAVYSLNGSKVAYGKITARNSEGKLNQSLDVSGYREGIYTILLNDGKKSYTLRFLKK